MGVQGVHKQHGLVLLGHVQQIWPHWRPVDAVGLPIDLMDIIGIFVDPVGIGGVLVDAVGLHIDLMDVRDVFVDPVGVWGVFLDPVGVQGVHKQHGLVLLGHVQHIWPRWRLLDAVGLPIDLMDVLVDALCLAIDLMDVIGVFVDLMGVQGVNEPHGLSEVTYKVFDPVGVLVDAVGLPIVLMVIIGVFVDPVGVQGVH